MWYIVIIIRNQERSFVTSPAWGKYELSPIQKNNTYLWATEEDARNDKRWQHLIQPGDVVEYHRTYRH